MLKRRMLLLPIVILISAFIVLAGTPTYAATNASDLMKSPLYQHRVYQTLSTLDDTGAVEEEMASDQPDESVLSYSLDVSLCFASCEISFCFVTTCENSLCIAGTCATSGCDSYCDPNTTCVTDSACMGSNCTASGCYNSSYLLAVQ
jgi:hypothetical protein